MSRQGQVPRITSKVQHPHGIDQLLLKPGTDAYYSAAEWPDGTHRLADRRDGVGDLRMPRSGRCWLFDGVDDYGSIAASASLAPSVLSVEFWLRASSSPANFDGVLGKSNTTAWTEGWGFYWSSSSQLKFFAGTYNNNAATLSGLTPTDGEWLHVVGVVDATNVTLYVDGVASTPIAKGASLTTGAATHPLTIGRLGNSNSFNFAGRLRGIRIYDVALSAAQVSALSLSREASDLGTTLGYWPCEEESGYTGFDTSGNGNHVTLSGITPSTFHAVDATVATSRANEVGHSHALTFGLTAQDAGFNTDNETWIGDVEFSGDFSISYRLENTLPNVVFGVQAESTPAATNNYGIIDYGVQPNVTGGTETRFYRNGSTTHIAEPRVAGDIIRIGRSGTTVTVYINGVQKHQWTGDAGATLRPVVSMHSVGDRVTLLPIAGETSGSLYTGSYVDVDPLIIPRAAGTDNDALGNACQYKGKAPHPGLYLPQVVTGDGAAVHVDCGSALIPAAVASFEAEGWIRKAATTDNDYGFWQGSTTAAVGVEIWGDGNIYFQLSDGTQHWAQASYSPVVGQWHHWRVVYNGSAGTIAERAKIYWDGVELSTTFPTGSIPTSVTTAAGNTTLMHRLSGAVYGPSRYGLASFLIGGVTKYVLPRGGSSRTVDVLGTDGSASTGTINGGSTSSIFANRGDGSWADPRVEHGGKIARHFDGVDDFAETAARITAPGQTQLSGAAWVTLEVGDTSAIILGEDLGVAGTRVWAFSYSGNNQLTLWLFASDGSAVNRTAAFDLDDGQPHHVAFSYDAGVVAIYVDGVSQSLSGSSAVPTALRSDISPQFRIAKSNGGWFTGQIWDAWVIDGAITESDAANLRDGTYAGASQARYAMIAEGGTEPDLSGNGHDLSYTGTTRIVIPTKLDDSQYADGTAIDTGSTLYVPANKLGDPNAQIDRTGGNSNTPFADDTAAPTAETTASDPNTSTSGKCRRRKTNNYVDRVGSSKYAQSDQLAEQFYGD